MENKIKCRPVDIEIVGLNLTHSRNLFLLCTRSLGFLSPFDKMSTGFLWSGSHRSSKDLKYGCMSFTVWLWSVNFQAIGLKILPDTNCTRTGIANDHLTCIRHL